MSETPSGGPGPLTVIRVIKGVVDTFFYFQKESENSSLAETRRQNENCLHILVMGGTIGGKPHDTKNDREINSRRGVFFSNTTGRTFYHPDAFFTPGGFVQWLVRSEWKEGGLNAENSRFPVVTAGGIGYDGFWWRQLSNDKGGGDTRAGYCRICAKEKNDLNNLDKF